MKSAFIRLAVQKGLEEVLEAEVSDAVGREYYQRAESEPDGYRNGSRWVG